MNQTFTIEKKLTKFAQKIIEIYFLKIEKSQNWSFKLPLKFNFQLFRTWKYESFEVKKDLLLEKLA